MLDVRPFDGWQATDAEIDEYHGLQCAVYAVDYPELPPPTRETTASRLAVNPAQTAARLRWLARLDGRLVGVASVDLLDDGNEHLAGVHVAVHPARRRQGIGTDLLRTVAPALRERGCTVVEGHHIADGSSGDHWTRALGFRVVHSRVAQMLRFADVDPQRWEVAAPEGYRLARWIGRAPDDLLDSYVRARLAIADAPLGASAYAMPDWSVARVRRLEAENREHGIESRVVVAVDGQGQVVGLTEVDQLPRNPSRLVQGDTAVLAAHRGHGLGVAMKAEMLRWVSADKDGLVYVWTSTGANNTHMMEVNLRLGYETVRRSNVVNRELAGL